MKNKEKITTIIVFLGIISLYIEILRNIYKVGKFFLFVGGFQRQGKEKGNHFCTKKNYRERVFSSG